ncbi:MAG: Na/Pi symporter [Candidatus Micrarchaeota archaeon]
MLDWSIILAAASGLILFLYGMEQFSREIQKVAGENFRAFLKKATKSTPRAVLLGCFVTAIAQSSTAVTMITIGLVDSGLISFAQSIGIILGAGIGTTLTAQLVAIKFTALGPVFIPLGFLLGIFGGRFAFLGKPLFFFGLVFFGINLVSDAAAPLKDDPGVMAYLAHLDSVPLAILLGFILTNVFQSSSVFTGLVVVLSGNGVLAIWQAIPLILGSNIGTLTPLLASFNLGLFSRRAAAAQLLFNIGGVLLILPLLHPFTVLIMDFGGSSAQQAANAHTLFNIITTFAFLVVLGPFTRLVERLVPGKEEEILFQTIALDEELPKENDAALFRIEEELKYLLAKTESALDESASLFPSPGKPAFQRLLKREALNDYLDERIEKAILQLSQRKLSQREASRTVLLVRMSNALEQLADLAASTGYIANATASRGVPVSAEALAEIGDIHMRLKDDIRLLKAGFPSISDANVVSMRQNEVWMRERINAAYANHLKRLYAGKAYAGSSFVKAMSRLETAHGKLREIRKLCEIYAKS